MYYKVWLQKRSKAGYYTGESFKKAKISRWFCDGIDFPSFAAAETQVNLLIKHDKTILSHEIIGE